MQGSPLPILPIQPLVKAKVIGNLDDLKVEATRWSLQAPGLWGTVSFDLENDWVAIRLLTRTAVVEHCLFVHPVRLEHGMRFYWSCPGCGRRCDVLVLIAGELVCRRCFRNEAPFARSRCDALLLEAEDAVRDGKFALKPLNGPTVAAEAAKAAAKRRAIERAEAIAAEVFDELLKPAPRPHDFSTLAAINRGQGIAQSDIYHFYCTLAPQALNDLPLADGYKRPDTVGLLGQYPELDIRKIWTMHEGSRDVVIGVSLQWAEVPFEQFRLAFLDKRQDQPLLVLAKSWDACEEGAWQRLQLHLEPGGRVRFICPVSGKRCDVLYERDGLFASREAQRLVHQSQRVAGRKGPKKHR